jgi:chorismate mutase
MITRAIRGATTVGENTKEAIKLDTVELLGEMMSQNKIKKEDISHVIFTLTKDINADFPAKFARIELGFDDVPMICSNEIEVPGALPLCIRVLMVVNSELSQKEINHVYLNEAKKLRPDLN